MFSDPYEKKIEINFPHFLYFAFQKTLWLNVDDNFLFKVQNILFTSHNSLIILFIFKDKFNKATAF